MNSNEVELEKIMVKYGKENLDTQLILTDKHLVFEQEKGLFKKKLKPVYILALDDIKMYKNEVKIEQKNKLVTMQTKDKDVSFTCDSIIDARKIMEKIIDIKTDSSVFDRATDKAKEVITKAVTVAGLVGTAAVAVTKNKKTILKGVSTLTSLFKK